VIWALEAHITSYKQKAPPRRGFWFGCFYLRNVTGTLLGCPKKKKKK